jgi:malonyl-CoA/methylmalonyl-CoA synthetase
LVPSPDGQPDLDAIKVNIATSLARFKHPQRMILMPELPRNTMGKVQKKALRDQFKDLFSS